MNFLKSINDGGKEAERVVITKPVPSRPTCSGFRSFSQLLADAVDASPPKRCYQTTTIAPIRPKTVRFRPTVANHSTATAVSSRDEVELTRSGVDELSDGPGKSDSRSYVVYKPKAKLVSKATVFLLANMGSFNDNHQQSPQSHEARVQNVYQKQNSSPRPSSSLCQNIPSTAEAEQILEKSNMAASGNSVEDPKTSTSVVTGDRPSHDGYNWRKYGQKQVKGSECPRSYYKCTHPSCPVKKKVERSLDGQIAEIVYKGEHNHPKPYPHKRSSSAAQGVGIASEAFGQEHAKITSCSSHLNEQNERPEGRAQNRDGTVSSSHVSFQGKRPPSYEPLAAGGTNSALATSDSCGLGGEFEEGSKRLEQEDDEPRIQRRKLENQSGRTGISGEVFQEPRTQAQSSIDSETLGDGFRWRKYGQKVVRGNSYPRSYYRCTSPKCNARKHVERASDDPRAFITTYEGKHTHEQPVRNTHPFNSREDSQDHNKAI